MSAAQPKERIEENAKNEDNEFEPQVKDFQEEVKISEDTLHVLPENEQEEKEEILLTAPTVELPKPKMSSSKAKSSRRRRDKISSVDVRKMLEKQTTQIDKIRLMLQSIRKDSKSTQAQPKLLKQLRSQINKLQNQLAQIQKIITKKSIATATTSRKKLNVKRVRK
ncbi:MAG: hypothetical protein WAZ77_12680 [Candidatus Nitrosopolaris sp.]